MDGSVECLEPYDKDYCHCYHNKTDNEDDRQNYQWASSLTGQKKLVALGILALMAICLSSED